MPPLAARYSAVSPAAIAPPQARRRGRPPMHDSIQACWIEQAEARARKNAENAISTGTAVLVVDRQGRALFGNSKAIAKVLDGCNRLKSEAGGVCQKVRPLVVAALGSTDFAAARYTTAAAGAGAEDDDDDPEPLAVTVCPIQSVGSDGPGQAAALVI